MTRLILYIALLLIYSHASAAPPDNADRQLAPWFQSLKQPGTGASCCSIADCRQVEYRMSGGHYQALVQGEWMAVPDDKVLQHQLNPTGHGVVCYTPWQGILCFVSAAET
jgi:hypothetical protein